MIGVKILLSGGRGLNNAFIRWVSTLPRASPNYDEFCKEDRISMKKEREKFSPPLAPVSAVSLTNIIQLSEKAAKDANNKRDWKIMEPNGLTNVYFQLSKHRLTMLVTATAASGYFISPLPIDYATLVACLAGTALLSSSANACNHILEAPYDAQMRRTQSRALVVHRITPLHALGFAVTSAAVGLGFICIGCNSLTATLGLLNLVLYAAVYTPMKRYHIGCTWVGAIVGAIPPLMGYTASTGRLDMAAVILAGILYSWQFPHFNALSWNLRGDYSRAGYHVMCVTSEELCRKTTLRHAIALLGICSVAAPIFQLSNFVFALESIPLNAGLIYLSYKFYKTPNEETANILFRYSLLYLPIVLTLMVVGNAGWRCKDKSFANETLQTAQSPVLY